MSKPSKKSKSKNPQKSYAPDTQANLLHQALALEETSFSLYIRGIALLLCFGFFGFVAWAWISPLSEIARAPGEIVPSGYSRLIQHNFGGAVKEIFVTDREMVLPGQKLVQLDGAGVDHDLQEAVEKQKGLELQAIRWRALMNNSKADDKNIPSISKAQMREQKEMVAISRAALASDQQVLQQQIAQKREALQQAKSREETARETLSLIARERQMQQDLASTGTVSQMTLLEVDRRYAAANGDVSQAQKAQSEINQAILELKQRQTSVTTRHREQTSQQLLDIEDQMAQNRQRIEKLQERVANLTITSPVRGLIKESHVNTIGRVIKPGETLFEIVPVDENLIADIRIRPNDIGSVRMGQSVNVKIGAYDFARFGMLKGTLQTVSATTLTDEEGQKYFRGRVILQHASLNTNSGEHPVLPGMAVQADIMTGSKTVMAYLMRPVKVAMDQAMTEQ